MGGSRVSSWEKLARLIRWMPSSWRTPLKSGERRSSPETVKISSASPQHILRCGFSRSEGASAPQFGQELNLSWGIVGPPRRNVNLPQGIVGPPWGNVNLPRSIADSPQGILNFPWGIVNPDEGRLNPERGGSAHHHPGVRKTKILSVL